MKQQDMDCVEFLQWALPQMRMTWPGFRKVRRQVCKRIHHRMNELNIPAFKIYRNYLDAHSDEWAILDSMCIVTISCFYRDREVFNALKEKVLPELAANAEAERRPARCWSAGCASGEEPYTLSLIWEKVLAIKFPNVDFQIIATDIEPHMLERAKRGCYNYSSVRELPEDWIARAFVKKGDEFCIKEQYKKRVEFLLQDIRLEMPEGPFDLILCRNLVGFYFEESLQVKLFREMNSLLTDNGVLVLGGHEKLPEGITEFTLLKGEKNIFRKSPFFQLSTPR